MVYNVPNRGGIAIPYTAGDTSFLWRRGDVVLNSAWQGDQPIASRVRRAARASTCRSRRPAARLSAWWSTASSPCRANRRRLADHAIADRPRPQTSRARTPPMRSSSPRRRNRPSGVKSGVVTIPSTDFAFADCRTVPFPGTPDPTRLCIKGGFDPALLYELVRPAKDPFVLGVGNAAMRDVISFFRYQRRTTSGTANPIAGGSKTVIGFGNSQSGRFQKHMLNNGFNEDEDGRIVWDGMNPNIAGMMGSFNIRFAQPGDIAELYFAGADGPLWWADYEDTVRGRAHVGPAAPAARRPTPARRSWKPTAGRSSGTAADPSASPAPRARRTCRCRPTFAATITRAPRTAAAAAASTSAPRRPTRNQFAANPNPQRDINRALYVAMVDWVTNGTPPPPSRYPRVSDGTLVAATSAAMGWPNIPERAEA